MSLVIDALRLAAVQALASDPVINGLVNGRVYDSRLEAPFDGDPAPVISVYTEEDDGEAWSANNGGPPFKTIVNLVIEVSYQFRSTDGGEEIFGVPITDRATEAMLGVLRSRIEWVIAVGDGEWSFLLRKHAIKRVVSTNSKRFQTDDAASRVAMRLITMKVEVKEAVEDDVLTPPSGEFAALPEPLRSICASMPSGSSGRDTCEMMAVAMAPGLVENQRVLGLSAVIRPGAKPRPDPTDGSEFGATANMPDTP